MTAPGFSSDARDHVATTTLAMERLLADVHRLELWGEHLAVVLTTGGRLLAVGNGGSAAQAQHLTSELVGRYVHERQPLSALALHAESSSVTAILNDYGADDVFARQVLAHGRPGDVLLALSTSGRSSNLVRAASAARDVGLTVWALTGARPNPLAELADDSVAVDTARTAVVQEVHQLAVHLVCEAIECALPRAARVREPLRA
jgi:phosphoheptose isomerase